jgi:anti-sigma regulatory factor (Ser/Thr protein kinase)
MATNTIERIALRRWLLHAIEKGVSEPIGALAANQFHISRQSANRELRRMVAEGLIKPLGETRGRQHVLVPIVSTDFDLTVNQDLREDTIWRKDVAPHLQDIPANVLLICQHGFTEMLNNVIDHSEATRAKIFIHRTAVKITMSIFDFGVGILNKIQRLKGLDDPQEAILELSKGKLTTDPDNHSGEGIFFTSRMFDRFSIMSGHHSLLCSPDIGDWWMNLADVNIEVKEVPSNVLGTCVILEISPFSDQTIAKVMNKFAGEHEDYSFSKTHVPVRLARYDSAELISRSQAKRLMARLNRFKEVVLDFVGIETIGQAFADQIFRVYRKEHPDVHIVAWRTSPSVDGMIKRAEAGEVAIGGVESRTDLLIETETKNDETKDDSDDRTLLLKFEEPMA